MAEGLSLTHPGGKEYLIIGGVALGGGLLYFWLKDRQAAASPAASDNDTDTGTGNTAPGTPTGLSTSQFLAWAQDHSSSTVTKTTTASPAKPKTPADKKKAAKEKKDADDEKKKAKTKGQKYIEVTVGKWTRLRTPWNSTLSGIADHYEVKGGYEALAKLNHIKDPNLIRPGQKIKVPVD
jgi:nucleoid-associated protein YgaU